MLKTAICLCLSGMLGEVFCSAQAMPIWALPLQIQAIPPGKHLPEGAHDLFENMKSDLKQRTQVPLRLPDLTLAYKDTSGLSAIVEDVSSNRYFIQIATSDDCPDGTNCHVGSIIGSTERISVKDGPAIPVTLDGRIKGFFVEADCGAHCDDSSINWKEGAFYYSINLKAASKEVMIKLANSALERDASR